MKTRYSDEELAEFKTLIDSKIEAAKQELAETEQQTMEMQIKL